MPLLESQFIWPSQLPPQQEGLDTGQYEANWRTLINYINGTNISSLGAAPASVGGDNLLINGDLSVSQRDFAGGALAPWTYGYDRWKAAGPGANISQVDGTITLASGWIYQVVEAPGLAGQQVTFSVEDPTAPVYVNIDGVQQPVTPGSGRRGVTFALSAAVTGAFSVNVLATNSTFKRMKLERGAVATPWKPRPVQQELALCQRYYYRIKNEFNKVFCPMLMDGIGGLVGIITMPVTMRTNPVFSRSANAADFAIGYPGSGVATDVFSFGCWPHTAIIAATAPTRTTPGHLHGLLSAPCWIAFDAEL